MGEVKLEDLKAVKSEVLMVEIKVEEVLKGGVRSVETKEDIQVVAEKSVETKEEM